MPRVAWALTAACLAIAACVDTGVETVSPTKGKETRTANGAVAAPAGAPSPSPSPGATPTPTIDPLAGTSGGIDTSSGQGPTPSPLPDATQAPTPIPRVYGDTSGEPIGLAGAPTALAFTGSGIGYAAVQGAADLAEFTAIDPGSGQAFTRPMTISGTAAICADGSGGLWVAGTSQAQHLAGAALVAGAPVAVPVAARAIAADATRAWIAGSGAGGAAITGTTVQAVAYPAVPAGAAADGSGGLWLIDAAGALSHLTAPGQAPTDQVTFAGTVALAPGDGGGIWLLSASGARHHKPGTDVSVAFGADETGLVLTPAGAGHAWAMTDKALYYIVPTPSGGLAAERHARTENWVPILLQADPADPRRLFAGDAATHVIRRIWTGS